MSAKSNWTGWIEKAIALVSRVFNSIGMVFLILLMLVITADVILRASLNKPIHGAIEISQFMMLIVVFLALAYTQHAKAHIAVDLLYTRFPKIVKSVIDILIYILSLGIVSLMTWQALVYTNRLNETNKISDILMVPIAPFEIIVLAGLGLFGLVLFIDLIHSIGKVFSRS
jgi:TRAP-type C4-dicarboxylate transport system permease small subunit